MILLVSRFSWFRICRSNMQFRKRYNYWERFLNWTYNHFVFWNYLPISGLYLSKSSFWDFVDGQLWYLEQTSNIRGNLKLCSCFMTYGFMIDYELPYNMWFCDRPLLIKIKAKRCWSIVSPFEISNRNCSYNFVFVILYK